jgi:hypothetical protein
MAGMSDLQEAIEQQQEQQAEQQKKIDEQERLAMDLGNAQKEQMLALAQERRARVISDISLSAERSSEAQENMAQAALARAKTITEIASMEDERLLKVLSFVNMLESQEMQARDKIRGSIDAEANQLNMDTEGSLENKQVVQASQQLNQEVENVQG